MIIFNGALIIFFCLFIGVVLGGLPTCSLAFPPVLIEIANLVKIIAARKYSIFPEKTGSMEAQQSSTNSPETEKLEKRDRLKRTINFGFRSACYVFFLLWACLVENKTIPSTSLAPGVYPALVYSIYSLGIDFLIGGVNRLGSFFILFYKICRILIMVQIVSLGSKFVTAENSNKLDILGLNKEFWPIHVGALLVLPVVLITLIYYLYSVIEMFCLSTPLKYLHLSKQRELTTRNLCMVFVLPG